MGKISLLATTTILLSSLLLTIPSAIAGKGSTYSWTVKCTKSEALAQWNWTQNGVIIPGAGGQGRCGGSGSGTVPSDANGITAKLDMSVVSCTRLGCGSVCGNEDTATKSFSSGTIPHMGLKSGCHGFDFFHDRPVSGSASFKLG